MGPTLPKIGIYGKFHSRYVVQIQPVILDFLVRPLWAERPLLSDNIGPFTSSRRRMQGKLLSSFELRFSELKLNSPDCSGLSKRDSNDL
jgi:hypothetical protein